MFLHQIISGTCDSHNLDSITDDDLCSKAALEQSNVFDLSYKNHNGDYDDGYLQQKIDHECVLLPSPDVPSLDVSHNLKSPSECTPQTPCFCKSSHYFPANRTQTDRKLIQANGQFSVTWNLGLGGKEFLLESSFLKAAFEQSVKDYINNDILCSDDLSKKGAEFFGVEIVGETNKQTKRWKAVSGNGKCKGNVAKCKVPIQARRTIVADDDVFDDIEDDSSDKKQKIVKAFHTKKNFCDIFLTSTIFDSFRERLLMAAHFNYDVDVNAIKDLDGHLNLQYDVTFLPEDADGLNQIEEVALDAEEPVPTSASCTDTLECSTQRSVMKRIFEYYGIAWDESKHECLYEGVNCNEVDMVTHIWMGKY